MKLVSKLAGALAASALLVCAQQAVAQVSLTLSTPDPDTSEITIAASKFAELVAAKTGGEVEVKVFPNGQLYGGDPSAAVQPACRRLARHAAAVDVALRELQSEVHGDLDPVPVRQHRRSCAPTSPGRSARN